MLDAPLGTHASWAKAIGRSSSTVRGRLESLRRSGILTGFHAMPNGAALGMREVGAAWQTDASLDEILLVPDTVYAGATIGGVTTIGAWTNQPDHWVDEVSHVAGSEPLAPMMEAAYSGPVLGALELRVLRAMLDDPRGPAASLAKSCGLSPKTVRRHRQTLVDGRAIRISPGLKISASASLVSHLHIHCEPEDARRVYAELEDSTPGYKDCPFVCIFDLAKTVGQQAERVEAIRGLGFEVDVVHERDEKFNMGRIRAGVDAAIAKWGGTMASVDT